MTESHPAPKLHGVALASAGLLSVRVSCLVRPWCLHININIYIYMYTYVYIHTYTGFERLSRQGSNARHARFSGHKMVNVVGA